jgi:DNA-directed RNA polymerase specialized sigma24 family protein
MRSSPAGVPAGERPRRRTHEPLHPLDETDHTATTQTIADPWPVTIPTDRGSGTTEKVNLMTDAGCSDAGTPTATSGVDDAANERSELLARARLLDPVNAEDLVQRAYEVGLVLQRRDGRPRPASALIDIMHALSDAQARLDGRSAPVTDVRVAARARSESLEDLDGDADEPELFYPDLYAADPAADGPDGWSDSPNQWRGGTQVLGPEEVDETGEVHEVVEKALAELPEPLGELLALVDLQGRSLADSAELLGLDQLAATAALMRARNHVRGRMDAYLTGEQVADVAPRL